MKKVLLAVAALLVLTPLISPLENTAQAQRLPDYVVRAVAEVTAYSDRPFIEENRIKQGSGVFVDHGGCLFTNSHVALNLQEDEPVPHLAVRVTNNKARPPEYVFEGEVIYVDQGVDLAYVCPKEKTDVFTHFFERKQNANYADTSFGQDVWIMGYPGAGEGTITISPGHIVGFINNPDVSEWVGIPDLDTTRLSLYKADALAGPGISGGMLVDQDLRLMGVPFAGSLVPGAFTFVLSENVYQKFEQQIRQHMHAKNMVPSDCVYDPSTQYYQQSGQAYYDNQCELEKDENMELEVKRTYKAFCEEEISRQRLIPAVRRGKELGSLAAWSDNLELICPQEQSVVDSGENASGQQAGSFAYGKARLPLEEEQARAEELKAKIDERFPGIQISAKNWSTIVNSHIYGGYPVEAIVRAIELGGYTVHPMIPFEKWQESKDYQTHI